MEKSPDSERKQLLDVNYSDLKSTPRSLQPRVSLVKQYSFQAYIFILTYFTYACLHTSREGWAFLKDKISAEESPGIGMSSDQLGTIDMVFLAFYSIGLYISGVLGDNMNKRLLLGCGYLIVCGASVMIGFGGIWGIK